MNTINSNKTDEIQLLSDDEAVTLTLALIKGAGGRMQHEELDAAMETTFDWAEKVRFQGTALEAILLGEVLLRCEPDGELVFIAKTPGLNGSSESIETDGPLQ